MAEKMPEPFKIIEENLEKIPHSDAKSVILGASVLLINSKKTHFLAKNA